MTSMHDLKKLGFSERSQYRISVNSLKMASGIFNRLYQWTLSGPHQRVKENIMSGQIQFSRHLFGCPGESSS